MEAVQKTIDILETFLKQPGEIGIAEISSLSGVNITTTYRIVSDLVKRGYLNQKQKRGKYSIGIKLLEFNPVIQLNLKIGEIALPFLKEISRLSGEYSEVAVLESYSAMTVAQVEIGHNLKIVNIIGERLPLHATSLGKLFLAFMDSEERKYYLKRTTLKAYTPNTLVDFRRLDQEIQTIRQNGVSLDDQEYELGIWSVAAPIYNHIKDPVAGLCIAAPSARLDHQKREEIVSLVKNNAVAISQKMGFQPDNLER